ncbi:MAG: phage portal protein [Clostridia bacterium]|nr:phage portal protein [Clostridia bacterium]
MKKITNKKQKQEQNSTEKLLIEEVKDDFVRRQEERRSFEAQWQLNMNFLAGNQYCFLKNSGEIETSDRRFFWQQQEIYNHIAPILERRLSKLQKIKPKITVFPASNDDSDIKTARLSKKIIESIYNKNEMSETISEATKWSEICGTSFYKVVWNSQKGEIVANLDTGFPLKSGDVEITAISPFEIFPESVSSQEIQNQRSIIHARAYHIDEIKNQWGVEVESEEINVLTLNNMSEAGLNSFKTIKKNYAVVIERYEVPCVKYPNGRLIIVAGSSLLHIGELPFINGVDGSRTLPIIKQVSISRAGCFWGTSIIERLIPLQRAYNAIKNRKHEFLNRLSMGILTVEDGSIDVESLEEDGLCPGKVLVYRQGANAPKYMANDTIPFDFTSEEESLITEFGNMSGVSDFASTQYTSKNLSGTALELLIEQDENKILITSDSVKSAIKEIAKHILRLYKQCVKIPKLMKIVGDNGELEVFYFNSNDISSDDIVFENKNELSETFSQRRNLILQLLSSGLLYDENGKISNRMKAKVLELLGFGIWESSYDLNELHAGKASKENYMFMENKKPQVSEIDDHTIHISEHTAFLLGEVDNKSVRNIDLKQSILEHISQHKEFIKSQI